MDRFREYIDAVLDGVSISKIQKQELEDEIYDHLNTAKNEIMQEGYSNEEAELMALKRFGDAGNMQKDLKEVFTPFRQWRERWKERKVLQNIYQWSSAVIIALFISLSFHSYVFAATEVKQSSMQNTLYEGQRVIENKITYSFTKPQRGDIVIINKERKEGIFNVFIANTIEFAESFYKSTENDNKRLIKRVIGVPGDTIDIRDGKVYLNGEEYIEPYVATDTYPNSTKFPITIPEEEYFVMGDNREVSLDSRDLGLFHISKIEGKVKIRLWPLNKIGDL